MSTIEKLNLDIGNDILPIQTEILGLEKKIGGHVFQVFVLNTAGLTSPQYLFHR